jgi:hypothetical protein
MIESDDNYETISTKYFTKLEKNLKFEIGFDMRHRKIEEIILQSKEGTENVPINFKQIF